MPNTECGIEVGPLEYACSYCNKTVGDAEWDNHHCPDFCFDTGCPFHTHPDDPESRRFAFDPASGTYIEGN